MKKFKFSLQTVHNVRELNSEKEKLALSELRSQAEAAASRVTHIEELRTRAVDEYLERLRSGRRLDPREMELSANHFASLNSLQKEAQKVVDEKRLACQRQLEAVRAASVEVKVTEKLKEGQHRLHLTEAERQQQKNLDELVSTKFARTIQDAR